jgi:hypothetical protein
MFSCLLAQKKPATEYHVIKMAITNSGENILPLFNGYIVERLGSGL